MEPTKNVSAFRLYSSTKLWKIRRESTYSSHLVMQSFYVSFIFCPSFSSSSLFRLSPFFIRRHFHRIFFYLFGIYIRPLYCLLVYLYFFLYLASSSQRFWWVFSFLLSLKSWFIFCPLLFSKYTSWSFCKFLPLFLVLGNCFSR